MGSRSRKREQFRSVCEGNTLIEMDPELHMQNRRYVHEMMTEYGGSLTLRLDSDTHGTLTKERSHKGAYASVELADDNLIDYHTHPSRCLNENKCTVPVPSPADVVNAVAKFKQGSLAHLIYVSNGTYLIRPCLVSGVFAETTRSKNGLQTFLKQVNEEFERLYQWYDVNEALGKITTSDYQEKFLEALPAYGLLGDFFKHNDVPKFKIPLSCTQLYIPISHDVVKIDDVVRSHPHGHGHNGDEEDEEDEDDQDDEDYQNYDDDDTPLAILPKAACARGGRGRGRGTRGGRGGRGGRGMRGVRGARGMRGMRGMRGGKGTRNNKSMMSP